jgi:hypothetical protein
MSDTSGEKDRLKLKPQTPGAADCPTGLLHHHTLFQLSILVVGLAEI